VVFVVEDGKARCHPVKVGPSSLAETIISEGLPADATVVVGPYKVLEKLDDGDPVRFEGSESNTPAPGDAPEAIADTPDAEREAA
jgi:hypothetical protein